MLASFNISSIILTLDYAKIIERISQKALFSVMKKAVVRGVLNYFLIYFTLNSAINF